MESNKTNCKQCNEIKVRILVGTYGNKNKKYADENGKLWNGKVCPECHTLKTKENMRAKRDRDRLLKGSQNEGN